MVKMMKDPNDYNVRAVERALQILNCFDDEHPERGVSEIAQAVELHKATTHRIVTTLVNYGYLERAADGQKYRLGLALSELGFKVIRRMDLRREAFPYMTRLVERWDEACDLSIFDHGNVFYIEVIQGNHALTISAAVGQRLPAYPTASGKLFLAYRSSEERDAVLSQSMVHYTDKTITSPEELSRQLQQVRRQGYAFDDEELEIGIRAVAAPIFNRDGVVVAAMSMPSPTSRMTMERVSEIAESLKEATQAVSRRLGWMPHSNSL
jgi:IclR family transcriptional regulator, KDG regulon repressor